MKKFQTRMAKCAAHGFHPVHIDNYKSLQNDRMSDAGILTDRQQYLIDVVLNNGASAQTAPPMGSLMDIVLKPSAYRQDSLVAEADKQLLLKTWEKSSIRTDGSAQKMVVSSEVPSLQVDRLRAVGLLAGLGENVKVTEKGRQVLVKMMLDEKSALEKVARNFGKLCKYAQVMQIQDQNSAPESGIYRDPQKGKWHLKKKRVTVPSSDDELKPQDVGSNAMLPPPPSPTPAIDSTASFSTEKLKAILASLNKAEMDCFGHRKAGSNKWDAVYDLSKVKQLKACILRELNRR